MGAIILFVRFLKQCANDYPFVSFDACIGPYYFLIGSKHVHKKIFRCRYFLAYKCVNRHRYMDGFLEFMRRVKCTGGP